MEETHFTNSHLLFQALAAQWGLENEKQFLAQLDGIFNGVENTRKNPPFDHNEKVHITPLTKEQLSALEIEESDFVCLVYRSRFEHGRGRIIRRTSYKDGQDQTKFLVKIESFGQINSDLKEKHREFSTGKNEYDESRPPKRIHDKPARRRYV
jgi:hypothetical protein